MDVLADLLDSLRASTLVYGRFELGAPWGFQLPDTEATHLIAVARGAARLEVGGARRPLSLSAGDLALLPHRGAHALRDAKGSPLHRLGPAECRQLRASEPVRLGGRGPRTTLVIGVFQFRSAHRALSIQTLARAIHIPAGDPAAAPWLPFAVHLLATESISRAPGSMVVMNRMADVLLVQTIRRFIAGDQCPGHSLRALADPSIGRALSLIHEQPAAAWTVQSMAAAVAMSRSAFAARFRALVGSPPLEYLARWRMAQAAQLLREKDLTIGEVAGRVGYDSEASFGKAFKRLEGVTPGAYRRQAGKRPAERASAGP